ncbi:unnamed protein product, partial [Ectocarpus sp. 12 AP-2014]
RISVLALCVFGGALQAKPLISSSEETPSRICLAREVAPVRIVQACDIALSQAGLTQAQRVEMMVARGDGLFWQDHFSESADSYRAATRVDADAVEAWNGLGWALWETDGDAAALEAFEASLN